MRYRRKTMMGEYLIPMPSNYTRVDGIKNPSNAYLDTGYKCGKYSRIETKTNIVGNYQMIVCSRSTGNAGMQGSGFLYYSNALYSFSATSVVLLKGYNLVGNTYTLVQDNYLGYCYVDGVRGPKYTKSVSDNYNLFLFSRQGGGDSANSAGQIIPYLRIFDYQSNRYVRYYIPCFNNNNVAGFWDAAQGVFVGSSNSTPFEVVVNNTYFVKISAANTNLPSWTLVNSGAAYTTTIVPDEGYSVYGCKVTMGGADITSTAYDSATNTISIAEVTGRVEIEVYAMHSFPSNYIRVDGIKNPSNAYLSTSLKVSKIDVIDVTFSKGTVASDDVYVTASKATGQTTNVGTALGYKTSGLAISPGRVTSNDRDVFVNLGVTLIAGQKCHTKIDHLNGKVIVDGVVKLSYTRKDADDPNYICLFSRQTGEGSALTTNMVIYHYSILRNNAYVRYYIPCLNDSGVAGFWDAASGVFQGSSNSTAFEAVAADGGDFRLINFEDSAVKNICVTNWGGHYKDDEMYTPEARAVTSLGNKFEYNSEIVKFNELQYFTGLTTLTTYREGQYIGGMPYFGAFHHCSNLEEITLPTITMSGSKIGGLFYGCSKLKTVDMSPITISGTAHICNICAICSALTSVILPTVSVVATYLGAIYAFQKCTSLLTVDASRVNFANMNFTNSSNIFPDATKLTRIIGGLSGFRNTENSIKACPLTHDAAVELLESLGTVTSARTITLKTSTYNTLTAEEKAIATNKGWTLNYAN